VAAHAEMLACCGRWLHDTQTDPAIEAVLRRLYHPHLKTIDLSLSVWKVFWRRLAIPSRSCHR